MADGDALLHRIRALAQPGAARDRGLLGELAAETDISLLIEAGRLLGGVPAALVAPGDQAPRMLRVAVAASFTAAALVPLLRVDLLRLGIDAEIHLCGAGRLLPELSDPGSELAAFRPEVLLCPLHDGFLLPGRLDVRRPQTLAEAASARIESLEGALRAFLDRVEATALVNTVPLSAVVPRTFVSFRGRAALGRIWREQNGALLGLAEGGARVHTLDLELLLVSHAGPLTDARLAAFALMAWAPGVERLYAAEAAKFCGAVAGRSRKCLVVDLDNSLWGGVLGDDGIGGVEVGGLYPGGAYLDFQQRIKALREQGVLLAISSKNDPGLVGEALRTHPVLALREEDFAAARVGWKPKDAAVREIAQELNLGLDTLVFADDSAFETELVRGSVPGVAVVRLDGDPSSFPAKLLDAGYFDVLHTTETDLQRTELYRARVQREQAAQAYSSVEDYLRGLGLRVRIALADEFTLPRIIQLGLRTNQFTMVKPGHSEARTRQMAHSADHLVLGFAAADRFSDEGLVGAVWLALGEQDWTIENFAMSCRVFSRGIEHAVLQHVADTAAEHGARTLTAHFEHTGRNGAAAGFYAAAGFRELGAPAGGPRLRYRRGLAGGVSLRPDWITLEREDSRV